MMRMSLMRMILAAGFAAMLGMQALAQTCDTLGGGVNCGRGVSGNPVQSESKALRAPQRTIGPNEDDLKIIGTDTAVDPLGRPKATLGGTTFHSDGRQCTRIGLTVTCK